MLSSASLKQIAWGRGSPLFLATPVWNGVSVLLIRKWGGREKASVN